MSRKWVHFTPDVHLYSSVNEKGAVVVAVAVSALACLGVAGISWEGFTARGTMICTMHSCDLWPCLCLLLAKCRTQHVTYMCIYFSRVVVHTFSCIMLRFVLSSIGEVS